MFDADREHFHHKLLSIGLDQRQAVWILYGAGLTVALSGVISLFLTSQTAALLFITVLIAATIGLQKLGYEEFAFIRRGTVLKAYEAPVLRSTLFVVFFDITIVLVSLYIATVLKYDDWGLKTQQPLVHGLMTLQTPLFLAAFIVFGVYRGSWRLASVEDLFRPTAAILAGGFASYFFSAFLFAQRPPITFFIVMVMVLLGLINGSRASYRILSNWKRRASAEGEPVLIYGAGLGGTMAVREALSNPVLRLKPVGFIDDEPRLRGRIVNGFPVLGSLTDLHALLEKRTATQVVLASDKVSPDRLALLHDICARAGAPLRYFRMDFQITPVLAGAQSNEVLSDVNSNAVSIR